MREFTVHYSKDVPKKFTLSAIEEEGKLHVGIAITNPCDSYNRKRGRTIAMGRARKNPLRIVPMEGRDIKAILFELGKGFAEDQIALNNLCQTISRRKLSA